MSHGHWLGSEPVRGQGDGVCLLATVNHGAPTSWATSSPTHGLLMVVRVPPQNNERALQRRLSTANQFTNIKFKTPAQQIHSKLREQGTMSK